MDVPAQPPPRPGVLREIGWHLLFALATVAVLATGLRLGSADIYTPFAYGGDALLILPLVKATIERGSHWRNERLGAPGVQELHDFPVVDHLHFAAIWIVGQFIPDPFAVYNLYYLLTYPLTTLTAMFVLRRLGLSVPAAGVGGLLYAFLPYHYMRGQGHYFLAAYFVVPLALLVALRVCGGRLPFFRRDPDGRYRLRLWSAESLAAVLIAAATASAGAYYAFFACALLLFAGCYGRVATGSWRAPASAGLVVAVIVAAGVANHAPTFSYQYQFGRNTNPTARQPEEAEEYGLKLTHLFLPVAGHHSRALAEVRSIYDSDVRLLQTENTDATLGLVGSAGLLVLLAVAVLPVRRTWPIGPLSGLTVFAVLLGTIGGLGALFNLLVTPQVRCYNRVSVFVAFLGLAAVCWLIDRAFTSRTGWARWPALLTLATFGVWDQTDCRWFTPAFAADRAATAEKFRADAAFFAEVERTIPGGSVFTLPYIAYPETFAVGKLSGYDHARGYLHTDTLRWSFGAMEGREADLWLREVSIAPPATMLPRLVAHGFDGLMIDRRGYSPAEADALIDGVLKLLGPGVRQVSHPNGHEVVYDLRGYRDRLRAEDPVAFEQLKSRESEVVSVLWLDGFHSFEPPGLEWKHRWCGPRGTAVFANPTARPRAFRVEAVFRTRHPEFSDLRIDGGTVWTERFPIHNESPMTSRVIVVPPGRHSVHFRGRLPRGRLHDDPRRLTFFVAQWTMTEVPIDVAR